MDTDRMISDAKIYEYKKGIAGIPNDGPLVLGPLSGMILSGEKLNWDGYLWASMRQLHLS